MARGLSQSLIRHAPADALVVVKGSFGYFVRLARWLKRDDVSFIGTSYLDEGGAVLRDLKRPIVVDHAVTLTPDQKKVLEWHRGRLA